MSKKISVFILSILFMICGFGIASCGESAKAELVLSQSDVVIYLGETEGDFETVNVRLVNVDVERLTLSYDNTDISVEPSAKKSDGSFDLLISSKTKVSTDEVRVKVYARNLAEAEFGVIVVAPISRIGVSDDLYIPFSGSEVSFNLIQNLSFYSYDGSLVSRTPDIGYTITNMDRFGGTLSIENGVLKILSSFENFNENIRVRAVVYRDGEATTVYKDFEIKVIPNAGYYSTSNALIMKANFNGSVSSLNEQYTLEISNNRLQSFDVTVTIPDEWEILVDVDSSRDSQRNIMQYLAYESTIESVGSSKVYTFEFYSSNLRTVSGRLYFVFYYSNYQDDELSSNFVKLANGVAEYVEINIVIPVTGIQVDTNSDIDANNNYIIFENYPGGVYGSLFTFTTIPSNASQRLMEITSLQGIEVYTSGSNKLEVGDEFLSGDALYIKATGEESPSLAVSSLADGDINKTIYFAKRTGISSFGFVEDTTSTDTKDYASVATIKDDEVGTIVNLYAPGAESVLDFVFDDDGCISISFISQNYYAVRVIGNEVASKTYTISTKNGYSVTLDVETIEELKDVSLVIVGGGNEILGIGEILYSDDEISTLKVKLGYSIELGFDKSEMAEISLITYSFGDALLGSDEYPSVYSTEYKNFEMPLVYTETSSVISETNLYSDNILTGINEGKTYLKIEIYGYTVSEGEIVRSEPIELCVLIEIYRPNKNIGVVGGENTIELRAENQLPANDETGTQTAELKLNALSNGAANSSYNMFLINGGRYTAEGGEPKVSFEYRNGGAWYTVDLSAISGDMTVSLKTVPDDFDFNTTFSITVFTVDLYDIEDATELFKSSIRYQTLASAYSTVGYVITIKVVETLHVTNIYVDSLAYLGEDEDYIYYEEIYIELDELDAGETNSYLIATHVGPDEAYDKGLIYSFTLTSGDSSNIIDVSENNGIVYIVGSLGGSGYITIQARDNTNNVLPIKIKITIADGKSRETAFRISNLSQITNKTMHYVLTGNETNILKQPLFKGESFVGGLYGRVGDGNCAQVGLDGCSLFDAIGNGAYVADLILSGTSNAQGMIANENNGTIENINVTTYISNGIYVPSLVVSSGDGSYVGGIVGLNGGVVKDCVFAGSVKIGTATDYGAICGINNGTCTNCKAIEAKFHNIAEIGDRIYYKEAGDCYVNGIITNAGGEIFTDCDVYSYTDYSINENANIQTNLTHSIGEENSKYGVVFYYGAKDSSLQSYLDGYNVIKVADLLSNYSDFAGTSSPLKVLAIDPATNNPCSFVTVSGDRIIISGVGVFDLEVYSIFDYTKSITMHMASVYYFDEFSISYKSQKLIGASVISVVKDNSVVITSSTKTIINVSGNSIELIQNGFEIEFTIVDADANEYNGINYITNNTLGNHAINAVWDFESQSLVVKISSGFGASFDSLINREFVTDEYVLRTITGTYEITTSASEATIEPKDGFAFIATILTDNIDENGKSLDVITPETIVIKSQTGYDLTNDGVFDVKVGNATPVAGEPGKYNFEISVTFLKKANLDYINRTYYITIYSKYGDDLYETSATITLFVSDQSLTNINLTMFDITSGYAERDGSVVYVASQETPTSVIKPTDSALLVVDVYPSFASFDYIELKTTSNTLAGLSYRVQKRLGSSGIEFVADASVRVEQLSDADGIRIYNNFGTSESDIGSYYIVIFPTNTMGDDAIITLTANAYLNGVRRDQDATFIIYVKAPEQPEISVDGKTKVYAYLGETITADITIAKNQELTDAYLKTSTGTRVSGINVTISKIESTSAVYNQYTATFKIPTNCTYSKLTLVVESVKVERGERIPSRPAELAIYITEFRVQDGSILIKDASVDKFNITSIKSYPIEMYSNLLYYIDEFGVYDEAIDQFKSQYYYKNDNGFEFGYYTKTEEEYVYGSDSNSGINMATWLYYVYGNEAIAIGRISGTNFIFTENSYYSDYVSFLIKDDRLYARGGDRTGDVPMLLSFFYTMPDGTEFEYRYYFTISNNIYTTEDMPMEIATAEDFINIQNSDTAYDYILSKNIYLYEYEVINDTSKINSLDGNNYTINIISFAEQNTASTSYALFNNISNNTTIKNLTVNYYYLGEIELALITTNATFAGFAVNNNGVIYNCEVMAFQTGETLRHSDSAFGIKLTGSSNATINVAGFVYNNLGSITNSRVGGDCKLITSFNYDEEVIEPSETSVDARMFTIRASGTLSGFVYKNSGVVSSSFVKNINIVNTYNAGSTMVTSGFVNTNDGTIALSYAQGVKGIDEIQASNGGIEGNGILTGFVYINNSNITDSYSNIMLKNSSAQVGRLGAGFVYVNNATATIERAHSFSMIAENTTTQLYFVGMTELMEYNNFGIIKSCYYYVSSTDSADSSIENLYGADAYALTNVTTNTNFYGYSFDGEAGQGATWKMTATGPALISADDIAHSVRYKKSLANTVGNSSLAYYFIYANDYALGTANNPIIIRSATEFNNVFGASVGFNRDIEDNINLDSKIAFGSYRLVNNINLNDLIIGEDNETEYKYSLSSTNLTLTGKYTNTSKRTGSFNGNGLTISNLAISNSNRHSENFGMFRSIEDGASVSNVNIIMSAGGVSADGTINVGILAGTVLGSSLVNISVKNGNAEREVLVVGSNVVGGIAGQIVGDSYIAGISIENISVTASYYTSILNSSADVNIPRQNSSQSLSIAGGAFGVVDIYTIDQLALKSFGIDADLRVSNVQGLSVSGQMQVKGMTSGGVIGYVGANVIAKDLDLTLKQGARESKIIAYNCYAGGIVGYNLGYLYQVKAEHEESWQNEIDGNIQNYYNGDEGTDRGIIDLFTTNDNISNKPTAIGGLVGAMKNGVIDIAYSRLNVRNENAGKAGGAVGIILNKNTTEQTGAESQYQVKLTEVYATGDVYAVEYIGGLVGYYQAGATALSLEKVNALNMWSKETIGVCGENIYQIIYADSDTFEISKVGAIEIANTVKFSDGNSKNIELSNVAINTGDNGSKLVPSYYSYDGVASDDGATYNVVFKQNDWYSEGNWKDVSGQLFPKIRYVITTSIYTIESTADFYKFGRYGMYSDSVFVVIKDGLIDCSNVTNQYGILKGSIYGLYDNSGFSGIGKPLFEEVSGARIADLKFESCSAPIAVRSNRDTVFYGLSYKNCNFSNIESTVKPNVAGIVYEIEGSTTFSTISFTNSEISVGSSAISHAGYLFATTRGSGSADSKILISGITVTGGKMYFGNRNGCDTNCNIGGLFGYSNKETTVSNVAVSGMNITYMLNTTSDTANLSIGTIAGKTETGADITISDFNTNNSKITVNDWTDNLNAYKNVRLGGLVGWAGGKLTVNTSSMILPAGAYGTNGVDIELSGSYENGYVGGLFGEAGNFEYRAGEKLYSFGQKTRTQDINLQNNSLDDAFATISVQNSIITSGSISVGGIGGQVTTINETNGMLAFNGNIEINQAVETTVETSAKIGGLYGSVSGGTISNSTFGGTIFFKEKETNKTTYYVGGLVGVIGGNVGAGNVFAVGDILLDSIYGKINSSTNSYVGGLVGQVQAAVTLNSNLYVLTTIYSKESLSNGKLLRDAVCTINESGSCTGGTIYYASNITLCTSDYGTNKTYKYIMEAIDGETGQINGVIDFNLFKSMYPYGTKIQPVDYDSALNTAENPADTTYYSIKYESTDKSEQLVSGTSPLKKVYLKLADNLMDINGLKNQISLENAFMFGDGEEILTQFTIFDNIDESSAVSGIVVRIYADTLSTNKDYQKYTCNAGFANKNEGVVYTCSVQETYDEYLDKYDGVDEMLFYGYLKSKNNISGFAYENDGGYIFGSFSNINLYVSGASRVISGFANKNTGNIDYSYASGYATYDTAGCQIDLFANEVGEGSGLYNCYTIFAAKSLIIENDDEDDEDGESTQVTSAISNNSGCLYEKDACEVDAGEDKAKTLYSKVDCFTDNKYFAVSAEYNYNYPSLTCGAFADTTYTKHKTTLNLSTKQKNVSGITSNIFVLNGGETEAKCFYLVPTITAFVNMNEANNYLLICSLNFGYNANGYCDATSLDGGLKNKDYCLNDFKGLFDGNGNYIINVKLGSRTIGDKSCNLIGENSGTIQNVTFQDIELYNSSGIIGTNTGTIQKTNLAGSLKYGTAGEVIGGLVAVNQANIEDCYVNLTKLYGSNSNCSYSFGGLVGQNNSGGTITNNKAQIGTALVVEASDNVKTLAFGEIVGDLNDGTISKCGVIGGTIEIIGAVKVYVGGVVGKVSGTSNVEQCYTKDGATIIAGSEDIETGKKVGTLTVNVPATAKSYAGGIVGYGEETVTNFKVIDCANSATVTARARWNINANEEGYKYIYDSDYNCVYAIAYTVSDAHAGGIISNYLTDEKISGSASQHLVNTGKVYGGFAAWKPVIMLATDNDVGWKTTAAGAWTAGAGTGVMGVGAGMVVFGGPVAKLIGVLVVLGSYIATQNTINKTEKLTDTAHLVVSPISGNSVSYNKNLGLYSKNGWFENVHAGDLNDATYMEGNRSTFMHNGMCHNIGYLEFKRTGAEVDFNYKFSFNAVFVDLSKYNNIGLDISDPYVFGTHTYYGHDINLPDRGNPTIDYKQVIPYFGGITECALKESDEYYSQYSSYSITDGNELFAWKWGSSYVSLECENENNAKLRFYDGFVCQWDGNFVINVLEGINLLLFGNEDIQYLIFKGMIDKAKVNGGISSPNVDDWENWDKLELVASKTTDLKPVTDTDEVKVFNFTNPLYWGNLVHTINNVKYTAADNVDEAKIGEYKYQGPDTKVIINTGVHKSINVSKFMIDKFDGTFEVKNGSKFTGFTPKLNNYNEDDDKTEYYGIIRQSSSAKITGFRYQGNVLFKREYLNQDEIQDRDNFYATFGLLLGHVTGDVEISDAVINIFADGDISTNAIDIPINVADKFKNISCLVGKVSDGTITLSNNKVDVGGFNFRGYTSLKKTTNTNNYSFGGMVASVRNGSSVSFDMANSVSFGDLEFISNINTAGAIVGFNGGTAEINSTCNVQLNKFQFASTGNTAVGGILGRNSGTFVINSELTVKATFKVPILISSDVIYRDASAYAGGIVAYSGTGIEIGENSVVKVLGYVQSMSKTGYDYAGYILAGYNSYSDAIYILPSEAYSGPTFGCLSGTINNHAKETQTRIIARSVAVPNSGSNIAINEIVTNETYNKFTKSSSYTQTARSRIVFELSDDSKSKFQTWTESSEYTSAEAGFNESGIYETNVSADVDINYFGYEVLNNEDGDTIQFENPKISNASKYSISEVKTYDSYASDSNDKVRVYEANIKFEGNVNIKFPKGEETVGMDGSIGITYKIQILEFASAVDANKLNRYFNISITNSFTSGVFDKGEMYEAQLPTGLVMSGRLENGEKFLGLLNAPLSLIGVSAINDTSSIYGSGTEGQSELASSGLKLVYDGETVSITEDLNLRYNVYGNYEEGSNNYSGQLKSETVKYTRTIASVTLMDNSLGEISTNNSDLQMPTIEDAAAPTYEVYKEKIKEYVGGGITGDIKKESSGIFTGGAVDGLTADDFASRYSYNGKEAKVSTFTFTSGDDDFVIISIATKGERNGESDVIEFVYRINNDETFTLLATLNYSPNCKIEEYNATDYWERYSSYLPKEANIRNIGAEYSSNDKVRETSGQTEITIDGLSVNAVKHLVMTKTEIYEIDIEENETHNTDLDSSKIEKTYETYSSVIFGYDNDNGGIKITKISK